MAKRKTPTPPEFRALKKILRARLKQVGKLRDDIDNDLCTMSGLRESCEEAWLNIQNAIDALSQLA